MRLASLGSGSSGNATLVEGAGTRLLVDCGFGPRVTSKRLHALGVDPATIDALVLTHEHGDHARGAATFARSHGIPLHATGGTLRAVTDLPRDSRVFDAHRSLHLGGLTLEPFPIVHDAAEPCQVVIADGHVRFAVLTDSGIVTPHIQSMLADCDGLLLECNHDLQMLRTGPYPVWIQDRIAGRLGHLSNAQAAALLTSLDVRRLQWLLAGHLSQRNNSSEAVRSTVAAPLEHADCALDILTPKVSARWYELVGG